MVLFDSQSVCTDITVPAQAASPSYKVSVCTDITVPAQAASPSYKV
jgi:hypothetical protein